MKNRVLQFYKENKVGTILGGLLCCFSFVVFFSSLAYGASCPEAGPKVCSVDLEPLRPLLSINTWGIMSVWMIIFFTGQQIMLALGIVTAENYSSTFFATSIMPTISFALTVFVFTIIGGSVQKVCRMIRK